MKLTTYTIFLRVEWRGNWYCDGSGTGAVVQQGDFFQRLQSNKNEVWDLERELSKSKGGDKELCEEILFSIQLVAGLPEYYNSSDLICRQQVIGSIFLEKMVFQDGELRTKKVNSAVELICRAPKDFKEIENKKSSEFSELSNLVPRTGIEPAHRCRRQILSLLRLPIPPPGLMGQQYYNFWIYERDCLDKYLTIYSILFLE